MCLAYYSVSPPEFSWYQAQRFFDKVSNSRSKSLFVVVLLLVTGRTGWIHISTRSFINYSGRSSLQLVKGESRGKIHVFRNISATKCVYTGVHFASLELPPAIRLSYRLLPVVKPYRSKRSSVGHFAGITIDKKTAFILGVCCASSIIFERRHNQYYISRLSNLKFLQKNYLYFPPILKLSLLYTIKI